MYNYFCSEDHFVILMIIYFLIVCCIAAVRKRSFNRDADKFVYVRMQGKNHIKRKSIFAPTYINDRGLRVKRFLISMEQLAYFIMFITIALNMKNIKAFFGC